MADTRYVRPVSPAVQLALAAARVKNAEFKAREDRARALKAQVR